jgi:hypothetical protein
MPQPITYDQASKNLNSAMTRYRARYLSGYDLPDVVRRATEAQSPETKLTRAGLEAKYTAPVYSDPKSDTYVAPEVRAALVDQEQNGARQYLSRVTDAAGPLYDRGTQSARFAIQDAQDSLQPFLDEMKRQRELEDYAQREAISARFRKGSPAPYSTLGDARKDPVGFFLAHGGQRNPDASGGFEFLDPSGNPISVEEAASSVPGATRADFLKGSWNPQDAPPAADPNAGFQNDLNAGLGAIRSGAKKKDVRARLIGAYPTYGSAIDTALGFK